ncbi:MAG: hypothetical protein CMN79_02440 [Spirochaetales bacterium]|nr:hypothetical protein [Spirochaetales bacterium]
MNISDFLQPHIIFLSILASLVLYKFIVFISRSSSPGQFDEVVRRATKNPEGYTDKTMISNTFKEWWAFVISPVEEMLIKSKIGPNVLTSISFLVSFLTAYLYANGLIMIASIFVLSGSSFDILDGRVARMTNQVSSKGAFLDSVLDRLSEIVIMFGLFAYFFPAYFCYVVFLTICFSLTVSYVKSIAANLGIDSNTGMMQRPERVVFLGIGGLASGICEYYQIQFFGIEDFLLMLTISVIAVFSLISTIQRILISIKN